MRKNLEQEKNFNSVQFKRLKIIILWVYMINFYESKIRS